MRVSETLYWNRTGAWCGIVLTLCMAVLVYGGLVLLTYRMAPQFYADTVHPDRVQAP